MRGRLLGFALAGVVAVCAAASAENAALPASSFFEEAKITVNERARATGYLRVRVTPENGEGREATIAIEKRMSENEIAKELGRALAAVIGEGYEVDRDAGEHVKIRKAKRSAANFSVEISFSSPGFAIILDN